MNSDMLTPEEVLRQELAALEREYREKCEPILAKLVEIENRKPMRPFVLLQPHQ